MSYMGVDIGTTGCKVSVYNVKGDKLSCSESTYTHIHPDKGWVELSPQTLWAEVSKCIEIAAAQANENVKYISFSSQGEGIIALDENYEAITNFLLSLDKRAVHETENLREALGDKFFFNTGGQIISTAGSAPKIMWIKKNVEIEPSYYACVSDYIILRLGQKLVTDRTLAARTLLYDIANNDWSKQALEITGITYDNLPEIYYPGQLLGKIEHTICIELGLAQDCMIVVGAHDQACALYGLGIESDNQAVYSLGTTETLICKFSKWTEDLYDIGLCSNPYIYDNSYLSLPGNFTGGNLLSWYKDQFENENRSDTNQQFEKIINSMTNQPTNIIVLPHFTTSGSPFNDDNSTGAIIGLSLTTTKSEIIRGLIEGVTYEILLNIYMLSKIGININSLKAVGGTTKSEKIMQLKSDVLGLPIEVSSERQASVKGAALLAVCGSGEVIKTEDWCRNDNPKRFVPDFDKHSYYLKQFDKYRKVYPAMKHVLE